MGRVGGAKGAVGINCGLVGVGVRISNAADGRGEKGPSC